MFIVLLTGHTREHVISGDPMASELFDSVLEKPMKNSGLQSLIDQVCFNNYYQSCLSIPALRLCSREADEKLWSPIFHRPGVL